MDLIGTGFTHSISFDSYEADIQHVTPKCVWIFYHEEDI